MSGTNYGQVMVAHVARIMKEANVTGVLWGEFLLRCFGSPYPARHIQFVLEDEDVEIAYQALLAHGYQRCTSGHQCPHLHTQSQHPAPTEHVYVPSERDPFNGTTVNLYQKSVYLPFFPSLKTGTVELDPSFFMFASDPSLPMSSDDNIGRYNSCLPDVVIPKVHKFVTALIYLGCRDAEIPVGKCIWANWLMSLRLNMNSQIGENEPLDSGMESGWDDAVEIK